MPKLIIRMFAMLALATSLAAGATVVGPRCRPLYFPVALVEGQPQQYRIFAELCVPRKGKPAAVHVALHGGMYNHAYWDWPYRPDKYSYVRALTAAGYAVLAVDRIGDGKSSRPPSAEITFPSNAYTIHQIVRYLRAGTIGGAKFERIVLVGHSMGSDVASTEANTYGDVDGVILTGFSHGIAKALASYSEKMPPWFMPANQDPRFKALNLDDGYITSKPGSRGDLFYNSALTEPKNYEVEEAIRDTFTMGEINTMPTGLATANINVPVLMVNGARDLLGCGPDYQSYCASSPVLTNNEAPHFSPRACLQALVMPQTKHGLTATAAAPLWYAYAVAWSNAFVGRDQPAIACAP